MFAPQNRVGILSMGVLKRFGASALKYPGGCRGEVGSGFDPETVFLGVWPVPPFGSPGPGPGGNPLGGCV